LPGSNDYHGRGRNRSRGDRLAELLLERRRTCRAQTRLLPPQAGGDGADVGDFAGTEAVDVGGAGLALPGSANAEPVANSDSNRATVERERALLENRANLAFMAVSLIRLAPLRRLC